MIQAIQRGLGPLLILVLVLTLGPARSQEQTRPSEFGPAQELAIKKIVREYLIAHPEVLIEALQAYQERKKVAAEERQQQAVRSQRSALFEDGDAPVLGNPEGDVVLVEFFDYRCPYCQSVAGKLRQAVEADGNIRLIMKEFPILGPDSQFAARAALASRQQGLYEDFHFALMTTPGKLDESTVMKVAQKVGLDAERLKQDMGSDRIDAMLRRNFDLAEALEIGGTPAFVIGDEVIPGALKMEDLRRRVAKARAKSS